MDVQYERLEGSRKFQYLSMLSATLTTVISGLFHGWSSPSLPQLLSPESKISITANDGSWLAVMALVGAPFGSTFGGFIVDIIGRKKAILLTSIPYFIGWILVACSNSFLLLVIGRFLGGVGSGISFCVVPIYLGEISDPKVRGMIGSSCSVTYIIGVWLINIIGLSFNIKTTAFIASAVPVLLALTFVWMPESPYYLLMKRKIDAARRSLMTLKGITDVETELIRLRIAVDEQSKNKGKLLDLFRVQSNRRAVFIMMGLRGSQHFCGGMAISYYAKIIFQEVGGISADVSTIIYFSIQLVMSLFSSCIVDISGRRPLLIVSIVGAIVTLSVEGFYFYFKNILNLDVTHYSFLPLIALIVFVVLFSSGLQNIPILMLGELFPTNVKAFAMCLEDIYFDVLGTVISKFFQITMTNFGIHVPFFSFVICAVLGLVFIYYCIPETKGRTLEDIQKHLKSTSLLNNRSFASYGSVQI